MQYTEEEKNELRKNLLCSVENNFNSNNKEIESENIKKNYDILNINVSLYKIMTENMLMRKKIDQMDNEIKELKKELLHEK